MLKGKKFDAFTLFSMIISKNILRRIGPKPNVNVCFLLEQLKECWSC